MNTEAYQKYVQDKINEYEQQSIAIEDNSSDEIDRQREENRQRHLTEMREDAIANGIILILVIGTMLLLSGVFR